MLCSAVDRQVKQAMTAHAPSPHCMARLVFLRRAALRGLGRVAPSAPAAGDWDDMRSSFYNADVIDALAERAEVTPESLVVDVGTGTGFVAAGLAGRAATVLGVDNPPAMLAVAHNHLDELGVDRVRVLAGELDRLPLPDHSVDAAVANMVLHHAPDPAVMLTEMARVVRPGGRVAVTDEAEHTYEWMRTEQADLWLGFSADQVAGFFGTARLVEYGYASLGTQ
ncbi:MAG: methyltransferase domain-containing protein [Streptosporangiales bacterium]|nr:methyltransferase domain-containing protein [Streptosporangiales bacterium]